MATYKVTAAAIVAKDGTPYGESYYYRDAILGAGVPQAEKDRLVAAGLVVAVVEDEAPAESDEDESAAAEVKTPPSRGRGRS